MVGWRSACVAGMDIFAIWGIKTATKPRGVGGSLLGLAPIATSGILFWMFGIFGFFNFTSNS